MNYEELRSKISKISDVRAQQMLTLSYSCMASPQEVVSLKVKDFKYQTAKSDDGNIQLSYYDIKINIARKYKNKSYRVASVADNERWLTKIIFNMLYSFASRDSKGNLIGNQSGFADYSELYVFGSAKGNIYPCCKRIVSIACRKYLGLSVGELITLRKKHLIENAGFSVTDFHLVLSYSNDKWLFKYIGVNPDEVWEKLLNATFPEPVKAVIA